MSTPAQDMLVAVLAGDLERVATLLTEDSQLCNLSDRSQERLSVLHHAAMIGSVAIVELLLVAGATVDKRSHDGSTPLHCAAAAGHMDIVAGLVKAGAKPRALTNSKRTSWAAAHRARHREIAEYLRELPARVRHEE